MITAMMVTGVLCALIAPSTQKIFMPPDARESESSYWLEQGRRELQEALEQPRLTNKAKNVILFLATVWMGITALTAGRILKGQKKGNSGEEESLVWDRFSNMGMLKTYNLDRQVPDSAATATAFLSGVKGNYLTLGVNGNVKSQDCAASLQRENQVSTILEWAQDAGKDTGVVSTAQVTHATPAALYAKTPYRYWQCDAAITRAGPDALPCKDIARQLVEDNPGRGMKVIMGGGRQEMGAGQETDVKQKCVRADGRDLVQEWREARASEGASAAYLTTTEELRNVNARDTDYIMGLFGDLHVPYELDRDRSGAGTPHIKDMVKVALQRLKRSDNGFFLMVEGGRIDHGLHHGMPHRALEELLAMEEAVTETLQGVDLEETLVVVTADHSHVMTMNGYPARGNDIFGKVMNEEDVSDHLPYTTLMFTNGEGFNYTWNGTEVIRRNLTNVDTTDKDFRPLAAVPTYKGSETHGGEDVAVYANGPMAHLFHRVHEQSYVAHVMGYAACIGPYSDCDRPAHKTQYKHVNNHNHHHDDDDDDDGDEGGKYGGKGKYGKGVSGSGGVVVSSGAVVLWWCVVVSRLLW
ncbi:Alkaline phosphatase, tissue-nonspecific isozyme [Chionoecetes opilio]|uniref:Alkaline phosphatase n=1 Tax=Chionoecetes opilio TaxID=41210 RepID=A0A8J4XPK5_CHIOP|nr:Alkaline phosphatase, tissue-nonspecific isozyme [Chionoecetes opilio]